MKLAGACLGTYQIEKLMADCRSGEVYQAQDLLSGRERVLLHRLDSIPEAPAKVEELTSRLAALGYLNRPGVVRVINFFYWDEQYWVVTDSPGGWPLQTYLPTCSPELAAKLWGQAGVLVGYLHSFYGGYAHGSLEMASFLVGFDGKLHLIELGWLTGSFGQAKAMAADLLDLTGLRQGAGKAGVTGTGSLQTASGKKFAGTCPGCAKTLYTTVMFCSHCGFDLTMLLPCPLGLQLPGGDVELFSAAQLRQVYPIYWTELEAALGEGPLLKWLRELGERELVILLEKGLRAREDRGHLLAKLIHRVLGDCPGSFWFEPAPLELGPAAGRGKVSLNSSLGFIYGQVIGTCGKIGLTASPQVFGGRWVELTVEVDRSCLAPGRHLALLELEVNNRREFVEIFFDVK